MNKTLPLFPLNIVVFPGEKLNLHIFEPRYKQLVLDCQESGGTFGMPSFFQNKVTEYGTELKLLSVENSASSGEPDIKTIGCGAFRIKEFYRKMPDKLYAGGEVEMLEDEPEEDVLVKTELKTELQKFYEALKIDSLFIPPPENFKAYQIGHHVGLSAEQEFQLLTMRKESERQEFILAHLRKVVPVLEATEKLKERIRQNGHYKHLQPPAF